MEIPDELVQGALDTLRSNHHAKTRAAYEYSEKRLKVILAQEGLTSDGKTVGEREGHALTSQAYSDALEQYRLCGEAYFLAKDKRDAASAVLDAWRTTRSDNRAMGKIV